MLHLVTILLYLTMLTLLPLNPHMRQFYVQFIVHLHQLYMHQSVICLHPLNVDHLCFCAIFFIRKSCIFLMTCKQISVCRLRIYSFIRSWLLKQEFCARSGCLFCIAPVCHYLLHEVVKHCWTVYQLTDSC